MKAKSPFFRRLVDKTPTDPKLLVRTHFQRWVKDLERVCQQQRWQPIGDHLMRMHAKGNKEEIKAFFDELTEFAKQVLEIKAKWDKLEATLDHK